MIQCWDNWGYIWLIVIAEYKLTMIRWSWQYAFWCQYSTFDVNNNNWASMLRHRRKGFQRFVLNVNILPKKTFALVVFLSFILFLFIFESIHWNTWMSYMWIYFLPLPLPLALAAAIRTLRSFFKVLAVPSALVLFFKVLYAAVKSLLRAFLA